MFVKNTRPKREAQQPDLAPWAHVASDENVPATLNWPEDNFVLFQLYFIFLSILVKNM